MAVDTLLLELGKIGLWIQAVGLFIVLWIIFQIILLFYNARRMKQVLEIKKDMKRIEHKLDEVIKKK